MTQFIKFSFLGFTSLFFFFRIVSSHRFCSISYVNDVLTANCAYRGRSEVPTDLHPDIKILILSHNYIERISSNSFLRYTSLLELHLNDNILLNNSIHKDAFLPLTNLDVLDISFMRYNVPFNLNWPPSVRTLSISKNRNQRNINLSPLPDLATLNAVDCSLMYFPEFNESASIKQIDLSKNPLNNFSVRDLAMLCQLEEVRLQWTEDSTLNSSQRWCDCIKIQTWLDQHGVTVTSLNCTKTDSSDSSCNVSFDEETQIFELCLEKSIKMGRYTKVLLIGIIPVIIIIAVVWCLFS